MTRRVASTPLVPRSLTLKSMAPEIEVRQIRPVGERASRSANSRASSAPSTTVQGTTTLWSVSPTIPCRSRKCGRASRCGSRRGRGRTERLDEALPLQFLLLRIHGMGDVHRKHEGEIDLPSGLRRPREWPGPREQDRTRSQAWTIAWLPLSRRAPQTGELGQHARPARAAPFCTPIRGSALRFEEGRPSCEARCHPRRRVASVSSPASRRRGKAIRSQGSPEWILPRRCAPPGMTGGATLRPTIAGEGRWLALTRGGSAP